MTTVKRKSSYENNLMNLNCQQWCSGSRVFTKITYGSFTLSEKIEKLFAFAECEHTLTFMCVMAFSTAADLRRVTEQPPNPPPVMREPYTPSTWVASSTSRSNSGHDTS